MENNNTNKETNENGNNGSKTKLYLTVIAAVLVILIIAMSARSCVVSHRTESDVQTAEQGTEVPQITPIFMYFVSQSDEGYDDYMKVIDELKEEYDGRVEFQITDVDENPESKENFPVEGNTPMLIMNNHDNVITAIVSVCTDKDKMTDAIEASFE